MKIWLARHGETLWNRERRVQGVTDVPLSDVGRRQAAALGGVLARTQPEAIYSSPLSRARETAEAIAGHHGLTLEIRDGLRELDQGEFEGMTFDEMIGRDPEFVRAWWGDPGAMALPGGESMQDLLARAWPIVEEIFGAFEREVIVVAHNMTIRSILVRVMGQHFAHSRRMRMGTGSLHRIGQNGTPWPQVELFNYTDHTRGLED